MNIADSHLITVKSGLVDGVPSVIFGIYKFHQLGCGRRLVKFKLSGPSRWYQRGISLTRDMDYVKSVYLQLVRERIRLDGSILYIDPNLMGREFIVSESLVKYGVVTEDLGVVFGEEFRADGLSLAFIVPDNVGVRQWVIDYMLTYFEFKGTLKNRSAGC